MDEPGLCHTRKLMLQRVMEIRDEIGAKLGHDISPMDMDMLELFDLLSRTDPQFSPSEYGSGRHAIKSKEWGWQGDNGVSGGDGDDTADEPMPGEGSEDEGEGSDDEGEGSSDEDPIVAAFKAAAEEVVHRLGAEQKADLDQAIDTLVETVGAQMEELDQAQKDLKDAINKKADQGDDDEPTTTYNLPQIAKPKEVKERTHEKFPKLVAALQVGAHVFLSGPPGTGKSWMALQAANLMELDYYVRSFNGQVMAHEIFGYMDAHGTYHASDFQRAYTEGGIYVADEFDNCSANLATGINQALAGDRATFADSVYERHKDFRFVACGNTIGTGANSSHVGTQRLNMATLDRLVRIQIDPDLKMEADVVRATNGTLDKTLVTAIIKSIQKARQTGIDNRIADTGCGLRMMLDVVALLQSEQWELDEAIKSKTTLSDDHFAKVFTGTPIAKDLVFKAEAGL